MDDMRRRYDVPRRDYGINPQPQNPPTPPQPTPPPEVPPPQPPVQPQPVSRPSHPVRSHPHQPMRNQRPAYFQPPVQPSLPPVQPTQPFEPPQQYPQAPPPQPQPPARPEPAPYQEAYSQPQPATLPDIDQPFDYNHREVPSPAAQAQAQQAAQPSKTGLKSKLTPKIIGITVAVLAIIVVAGLSLMPKTPKKPQVLPADLAKSVSFSFYYPQPIADGYNYASDVSTTENGQAYYALNKGTKHMIIHEQANTSDKLDLSTITNPVALQASIGKAYVGSNSGQTIATALAGSTLINITTNGYVPVSDISDQINNLKVLSTPSKQ